MNYYQVRLTKNNKKWVILVAAIGPGAIEEAVGRSIFNLDTNWSGIAAITQCYPAPADPKPDICIEYDKDLIRFIGVGDWREPFVGVRKDAFTRVFRVTCVDDQDAYQLNVRAPNLLVIAADAVLHGIRINAIVEVDAAAPIHLSLIAQTPADLPETSPSSYESWRGPNREREYTVGIKYTAVGTAYVKVKAKTPEEARKKAPLGPMPKVDWIPDPEASVESIMVTPPSTSARPAGVPPAAGGPEDVNLDNLPHNG